MAQQTQTQASYYTCDITDADAIARVFQHAEKSRYPLQGLITCHGLSAGGDSIDFPLDKVRKLLDVNLTGTYACAQAAAKEFRRRNVSGSIVLVASMSAHGSNKVRLSPISLLVFPIRPN